MRKVLMSLLILGSAMATPAVAQVTPANAAYGYEGSDLPPGCFRVFPGGPVFCLPLPIE